ncbi:serine/threonine protein kinase [Nocardiopsis sp. TSRI0078]|uniref:serine/threonine protein kinase n=1 Tax=unclassified Nocardiopsis TaxID=2649073 RepID=UPI00093E0ABD|nr:protein kinase [Nocardiopsis sp. TSRI0078]OKI13633.1 serine/threonine protein kinase [Nocardiopsis sp. TSRI0078]
MSGSEHTAWAPGYDAPSLLCQGRRARIVRATRSTSGADVVLKVLPEHLGRAELNQLRDLDGVSGVVPLLDAGTTADGDLFVVLPFYADGSFGDMLARRGPAPIQEAAAVARSVAAALGSMHGRGLLHNDVCPGNVLRAGRTPVLTGFGSVHRSGEALPPPDPGTESFLHAAPEALRGQPRTPASDVYQLASTIWTMLVGHTPFSTTDGSPFDAGAYAERVLTQDPRPVPRSDISRKLRGVLSRALSKLPEERFPTPAAFASAFEQARTSRPATTLSGATGGQNPLSGAQAPASDAQDPVSGGQAPVSGPQNPVPGARGPASGPHDRTTGAQHPTPAQTPMSGAQAPVSGPQVPPPPYAVRSDPRQGPRHPGTGPQAPPATPPAPPLPTGTGPTGAGPDHPRTPPSGPQTPPTTAWFPSSGPQASHAPAAPPVPPAPTDPHSQPGPPSGPQAPPHATEGPATPFRQPPPVPRPSSGPQPPPPPPHTERREPSRPPTGLEGSRLPATDAGGTAEIMMAKLRGEEISPRRAWSRLEGWTGTAESSFLPVDEKPSAAEDDLDPGFPQGTAQGQARWRRHLHIAVTVCGILLVTSVSSVFAATGSRAPVVSAAEAEPAPEPVAEEEPAEQVVEPTAPPEVSAPSGVALTDNLGAVELTWTDNSGGTASFFVLGGPSGHDPLTLARTGPGAVSAQIVTEDTVVEYCFTVVAVEGSSAAAEEVCTTRAADRAEAERLAEEAAEEAAEEEAEEEEAEPSADPSPSPGD